MILFIITIFSILSFLVLLTSYMTFLYRKQIQSMTGMMTAMGVGMTVSLTIGVLLGGYLQSELVTATILSMGIGILTGLLVGFPISLLAVLDGILAGVMGGMMGAMLGVMISLDETILLVKLLLCITVIVSFICIQLFPRVKKETEYASIKWFIKPLLVFIFFISLFIGIDQINVSSENTSQEHANHLNKNSSSSEAKTIEIITSNNKYSPTKLVLTKAETIEIKLINSDDVEHDFEISNFPHKKEFENTELNHNHNSHAHHSQVNNNEFFHLHVQPNSTSNVTLTPLEKGNYEFYCTIPGHKEAGMVGILVVN
ncbi:MULTISPECIES: cupredoxin domain-containing protein [Bacillus]|uniref:cupredoxin domain-containing protein n=1 Tax=Bacillus TaxID=1386 RepID=UPI0012FF244A|nr:MULTISPECIES: cupredoxin domain-containing protein [Bacillus]